MKKLLLVATLLVVGGSVVAVAEDINSAVVRTAIVVSDLDDSKQFYASAFGFTPGFDGDISGEWVEHLLQLDERTSVRFAILSGAMHVSGQDVDGAMIGLMQVSSDSVNDVRRTGGDSLGRGEVVLAVVTDDIEAVHLRLQALEAEILVPPSKSPNGREVELVVRDPDGVRIHVVQRLLDLSDPGNE